MQGGKKNPDYKVLVVDVDGTLIRTDLLQESVFAILRRNFFYLCMLPVWLLKGKAHLKQMLAERVEMSAALLPYREDLLTYLHAEHAAGRKLLLATASNVRFATAIANHLGIFADVLGSTATENLKGARKLTHIQQKLGNAPFAYAGDSVADLPIWKASAAAVLVDVPNSLRKQVEKHTPVVREFEEKKNLAKALFKAMRPHQWLKNTLIFVPLVLAHRLDQGHVPAALDIGVYLILHVRIECLFA